MWRFGQHNEPVQSALHTAPASICLQTEDIENFFRRPPRAFLSGEAFSVRRIENLLAMV